MGDVVQFSLRRKPATARQIQAETAEIMFFTGVRYQRAPEPSTDDRPSSQGGLGGKRKRKRG